ncbi:MAG: hypothetical protein ACP5Q4_05080 [Candidatus Caldatribacteriaceae bacterium]
MSTVTEQARAIMEGEKLKELSLEINQRDRGILQELAREVREIAAQEIQEKKRKLWYALNALKPIRPVVFCDPENGWNEIVPPESLRCEGPLAREWEMKLRKEIFWGQFMGDDKVIEPYFDVPYLYSEGDWGMREQKIGGTGGGSYRWEAPLKDYRDLGKIHFPEIEVDHEGTKKMIALAEDILGDFLKVRLKGSFWWSLGMTWTLVNLRGLEQIMYDIYDHPQELHHLMILLRDGHLRKLSFLEENNLLSLNNDGTYVGSGGFGYTHELPSPDFDGTRTRTQDLWGFAESQETIGLSPQAFAEFVFPYQYPILERFGLNCYGCCEPLDKRWDVVKKFPKLRRISVSPWANRKKMAEYLENRYIFSLKPNPAYLAVPRIDEEFIRKELRKDLETTRGCVVEIIMKDNHTIDRNPENVIRFCQIAREEIERVRS